MKFKVTKIATAVAVGLGVSATGLNVAHADGILFPYFAVSDTVTSVITTINLAEPNGATAQNPQTLHYRFFYKRGGSVSSYTAPCEEFDTHRITSKNDVVTFDVSGHYENKDNKLSVLAEPADRQTRVNYNADGKSFAMMKGLTPARGYLVVDNDDATNVLSANETLFGEIMLLDFSEGAVWGYAAYNAASNVNAAAGRAAYVVDDAIYSDSRENNSEVIAGNRALTPRAARTTALGGDSPPIPVNILPIKSDAGDSVTIDGDVYTRFLTTPIGHEVVIDNQAPYASNPQAAPLDLVTVPTTGQQNTALQTQIRLTVEQYTGTPSDVLFDRDERPVSGQIPQTVTCVAAVRVQDLVSAGALLENGLYGGWSAVQIRSPGALVTNVTAVPGGVAGDNDAAVLAATRTNANNQATVIKLEYNPDGSFLGERFKGAFNNAIWLRSGIRESIRTDAAGAVLPSARISGVTLPVSVRTQIRSAQIGNQVIDVGADFNGTGISVQQ